MAATGGPAGPTGAPARRDAVIAELTALYDLTARLRRDCPWDRVQTQHDIVAYTLEETYELVDAVRGAYPGAAAGDRLVPTPGAGGPGGVGGSTELDSERHRAVCGELGDLLFQVYFLAQVAEDAGWYDLGQVAAGIRQKLIRRHPHIFAEAEAETPEEVRVTWDRIKRDTEGREGIFHEVPAALPATLFAHKLQQRAAAVGFDWAEADEVLAKIREEADELERALAQENGAHAPAALVTADDGAAERRGERPRVGAQVAQEVGDMLFAVVNLARKVGADPELELRTAAERFRLRVDEAARLAGAEGVVFAALGLDAQEGYYQRAKAALHGPGRESPRPRAGPPAGHTEGGGR